MPLVVTVLLVLLGGYEAILGFRQLYGFSVSNHNLYALTGSFYNPGPYMGYLAMVLPVCVYVYVSGCTQILRCAQDDIIKKTSINVLKYSAGIIGLMILCLLPSGMSRSAWVAAVVSVGYVMAMHHREKLRTFLRNHWKGVLTGGAVLAVLACGAYHLKKDSADGRLLMWKVAARAVCERPWTGYGWESVAGAYGDAQEAYFANGDYTATEAHVAGSPEYVFNEYLQVAMAWGVPVLVICLLVLVGGWCIAHRRKQYGLCGALLSFGVFAFSSYPLQFPLFVFSLVLLWVGCILSGLPHQKRWGRVTAVTLMLIALMGGGWLYSHQQQKEETKEKWERCRVLYQSGAYSQAVESYAEHYEGMKLDARYLFEYGHALHKLHCNEESNRILQEALKVSSDPMILNIIGKNFQEMQQYKEAEHWLLRSTHRLPGRIYPYYLLAKLYQEAGDYFPSEKQYWAIRMVLETEPKVHSRAIDEMREEVKRIAKNVHSIERKQFGK